MASAKTVEAFNSRTRFAILNSALSPFGNPGAALPYNLQAQLSRHADPNSLRTGKFTGKTPIARRRLGNESWREVPENPQKSQASRRAATRSEQGIFCRRTGTLVALSAEMKETDDARATDPCRMPRRE